MKILLINDNSAHLNWGAQASPPALVQILDASLPGCDIRALPHTWLTRRYRRLQFPLPGLLFNTGKWKPIRPFLIRSSRPVSFYPTVADDFNYWANEFMAGRAGPQAKEFLALANEADLIVYNGENSIYRNTDEGCRGIFLLWLVKTRLKKPACIVNHTAHLDGVRPIMPGMIKLAYPELDLVAVREPCSLRNLQSLGIENVELFPDVVFALDPSAYPSGRVKDWARRQGLEPGRYFCLSASGLPVSTPRGKWEGGAAALVRQLKDMGLQAVLLAKDPWCLFLEEVARRTNSVFFGPGHVFADLWPILEDAAFLVTGHYHYAIFSAMVGCPFVPLSVNNHKMEGVCEHLDWHLREPFDATSLLACGPEIEKAVNQLREDRPRFSLQLQEKAASLKREVAGLGTRLAETAGAPRHARSQAVRVQR